VKELKRNYINQGKSPQTSTFHDPLTLTPEEGTHILEVGCLMFTTTTTTSASFCLVTVIRAYSIETNTED